MPDIQIRPDIFLAWQNLLSALDNARQVEADLVTARRNLELQTADLTNWVRQREASLAEHTQTLQQREQELTTLLGTPENIVVGLNDDAWDGTVGDGLDDEGGGG